MRISSLIDTKTHKEYVTAGMALNTLQTAEDMPILWDAWDIDVDYQLKLMNEERLLSTELISQGPLLIQIRNRYQIGKRSDLVQDVIFYAHHPRIDFVTRVNWQEEHQLLKTLFPIDVQITSVKCEIQYGYVERNTYWNVPADRAKFEMCAHKWIAADDGSFGAALLNDCKYGHDVRGSELRLTLLKSAKAPDETADMDTQAFTYAFLPYQGAFTVDNVVRHGYDLNVPLHVVPGSGHEKGQQQTFSLIQIDNANVIVETVKKAEQDDGVVLRLYEASGGEQHVTLTTALRIKQALLTNLLEDEREMLTVENGKIHLTFWGFEIKTLKLLLS
jgi:alpha-mannosidase